MRVEGGKVGEGSGVSGMEEASVVGGGEDIVMPEERKVIVMEGWLQREGGNDLVE